MKTRLLIIIGIVLTSVVISSVYVVSVQYRCQSLLGDTHYPRPLTFWNCLDYLRMVDNPPPKSISVLEPDIIDSLKLPNAERDAKLSAGYKLYPGVGWVHPDDQGNQEPIYRDNPNNSGELILDIDAMLQYQKILDWCHRESLGLGVLDIGLSFNNETHFIDNNNCVWEKIENED